MSREDDLLEQAMRAMRDEPPPTREELADGRAVLMWAQRGAQRKKQRGRTLRWVLPLAAVLTAGTALAATGQIERMAEAVTALFAPERAAEKAKRPRAPKRPVTAPMKTPAPDAVTADAATAAAPAVEPEPPAPQPAPTIPASPAPKAATSRPRPRPSAAPSPRSHEPGAQQTEKVAEPAPTPSPEPAPALKPSPDLAAYRTAHALHFRTRDFGAALEAWDAYLEAFPHGTFAIEAIYNRAICLLRLGRKEEARRALLPFARGAMQNGYRRAEAQELLEALE